MKIELEKKLFDRFKFYNSNSSLMNSLMGFGFECGEGWFNLLWELSINIEKELAKIPIETCDSFEVIQVKEKYGGLRFYTNWENNEISKLIEKAESQSEEICEECGNPGKSRGNEWIITLCDKCYTKRGAK